MIKEKLIPVRGFEEKYLVSESGKIYTKPREITFKRNYSGFIKTSKRVYELKEVIPAKHISGYLRISLIMNNGVRVTKSTHRVILNSFIECNDPKMQVNHINGIKTDNRVCNLEWVTQKENMRHAYDTGLKSFTKNQRIALTHASRNRFGILNPKSKPVINMETGIFYESITEASKSVPMRNSILATWVNGVHKNKSFFKYA